MKKTGKIFSIKIGGSNFPISTQVEEVRIKHIEDFINRKFEEIKNKNERLTFTENLALTLLHITDLLIDSEEKNIRMKNEILRDIKSLRSAIAEICEFIAEKKQFFEDDAG